MKFNFRKIASVLTSTVMLSSTLAFAAAANYPAPFVQSGNADVAIVYGAAAAPTDYAAVLEINSQLTGVLASQTASGSGSSEGSSTITGGDFVKLERSNDKFNLGEGTQRFYSTLDEDELSKVLGKGVYKNDDNNEYDFEQQINTGNLTLTDFQDSDFNDDKPTIGFDLNSGQNILNYTLDFTPDAAEGGTGFNSLETTDLTMLGRTYYIVQADATSSGVKLTLLDTANSAIVTEGETKSITVGNSTYDVSIDFVDSSNTILTVNGVQTNKLQEGDVFKVANDVYVAVKNILYNNKDNGVSKVEISLGSGKIVLENGKEVQINNEDVSENSDSVLNAYITNSSTDVSQIKLEWNLDDDAWLAPGSDLVLPGFETIKLSMGGFNVPMKEMTSVKNDGDDKIKLSTTIKDGDVSFSFLNGNATDFTGLGDKSNKVLVTNSSTAPTFKLNESIDSYFVATWVSGDDAESYAFQISSIDDNSGKNSTQLDNLASGGSDITLQQPTDTKDVGRVRFTLVSANDALKTASVMATSTGSGTVYGDRLVTKEGLLIKLPVNSAAAGDGNINITGLSNVASWTMNFTEEDEDGNIAKGPSFTAVIGHSSQGAQVSSISVTDYETSDSSDDFEGYVLSPLATKTLLKTGGDQDTLDVEYHGDEAFADVFISEAGAAISSSGGVVTTGGTKVLGSVAVSDSEVSSVSDRNLIVVGGSCVNQVAADLLGLTYPSCASAWEQKTGVGAGSFLVQSFARSNNKVATLVAGYNAPDTTNAAKYLTTQTVDTTVGKKYKGSSATSATLVTESA